MNVNELFKLATANPENGVGSTSRLRLAHGVFYYRDSSGFFYPMFAYMGDYLLNFEDVTPWRLGASRRTRNMIEGEINTLRRRWAERVGSLDGEFQEDQPAVVVNDHTNARDLKLTGSKIGPTTSKMLAMGINPESGKTRSELLDNGRWQEGGRDIRLAFHKDFEEQIRWLAYGAICRENSLRDMANLIGQMKLDCDNRANDVVEEMQARAANHFAPEDFSSAGLTDTHLKPLSDLMERFGGLAGRLRSATNVYSEVALAAESCLPRVDTENWSVRWNTKVGHIELGYYADRDEVCQRGFNLTGACPHFTLKIRGMSLIDYNARSFSYYWVRRNLEHYQSILGRLNFLCPALHEMSPEEWEYTELAAPMFATQDQK